MTSKIQIQKSGFFLFQYEFLKLHFFVHHHIVKKY